MSKLSDNTRALIEDYLHQTPVVLFMKGTPEMPMCGFSGVVVRALEAFKVPFMGVNVLDNDEIREGIKLYSEWPTIPQLYINSEFVGGADIVRDLYESGEWKKLLEDQGIIS